MVETIALTSRAAELIWAQRVCDKGRVAPKKPMLPDSWTASVRISAGCILALVASGAFAQSPTPTPSPESVAETERVIVTGSHIPTAEEVGPNPVLEISREQIEESGDRTTAELLRRLPVAGLAGVPTVNNGLALGGHQWRLFHRPARFHRQQHAGFARWTAPRSLSPGRG